MFGLYIAGAVIFGLCSLLTLATSKLTGWSIALAVLVDVFVEFLLVWEIFHS
jgi:hypothetical protein